MSLLWITEAKYIKEYQLGIQFNTNEKGTVNLKTHLDKKIFEPLKNIDFFKDFQLNSWTIEWNNGADFSPEFLYQIFKKRIVLLMD